MEYNKENQNRNSRRKGKTGSRYNNYSHKKDKYPLLFSRIEAAEQEVLGRILWNPDLITQAIDVLKPEDFRYERHKYIFNAMLLLRSQDTPIDELSLWSFLKERGELDYVGGSLYITYLPLVAIHDN